MAFLLDDDGEDGVDALLALLDGGADEALDIFLDENSSTTTSSTSSCENADTEDLDPLLFLDALIADDCACGDALPLSCGISEASQEQQVIESALQEPAEAAEWKGTAPHMARASRAQERRTPRHKSATKRGAKTVRSWDPNKARKEQRAELLHLRQQAEVLERQLSTLQASKRHLQQEQHQQQQIDWLSDTTPAPQRHLGTDASMHSLSLTAGASRWQLAAVSERNARARAEAANAQMKLVLENQLQIAKSLEAILQATASTQTILGILQQRRDYSDSTVDPASATPQLHCEILSSLFAGVDESYAEVDSVFAANGLALGMDRPRLRSQMHYRGASEGVQLEITANERLPFNARATSAAVWHYFTVSKQTVPYRVYNEASPAIAETTRDTHVEHFHWRLQLHGTSADFEVKQVLRRYEETERVVVVWRSVATPVKFAGEPMSGVQFLEKGYNVIKKPRGAKSQDSNSESLLQSCYVITPAFSKASEQEQVRQPRVGAVTDFMLHATAAGLSRSHRMIESVLRRGYAEQESAEYAVDSPKFELLRDEVYV